MNEIFRTAGQEMILFGNRVDLSQTSPGYEKENLID
jgi:hypothetical protein